MKAILITMLLCVSAISINTQEKQNSVGISFESAKSQETAKYSSRVSITNDECSSANLLLALTKAAKQLPDYKETIGDIVFSGGTRYITWSPAEKYSGSSYIAHLKAIADDKEKEAKDARELAEKEETRENDIKLVKRLVLKCASTIVY